MTRLLRALFSIFLAPSEYRWLCIGTDDQPIYRTSAQTPERAVELAMRYGDHVMSVERFCVVRNRSQKRAWIEVA